METKEFKKKVDKSVVSNGLLIFLFGICLRRKEEGYIASPL